MPRQQRRGQRHHHDHATADRSVFVIFGETVWCSYAVPVPYRYTGIRYTTAFEQTRGVRGEVLWEREGAGLGSLGAPLLSRRGLATGRACMTWSSRLLRASVCAGRIGCELVCQWVSSVVGFAVCDCVLVPSETRCSSRVCVSRSRLPGPPGAAVFVARSTLAERTRTRRPGTRRHPPVGHHPRYRRRKCRVCDQTQSYLLGPKKPIIYGKLVIYDVMASRRGAHLCFDMTPVIFQSLVSTTTRGPLRRVSPRRAPSPR